MRVNPMCIALVTGALLLAGCAETEEKDADLLGGNLGAAAPKDAATRGLADGQGMAGAQLGGAGGYGADGRGQYLYGDDAAASLGPEFSDPGNPLSRRTIYFMLDSSQVQPDFVPVIAAHARYLVANPSQRVIVEGHCDERGSREYNIALGEQRAKAVANMLRLQGVADGQLQIVSYGEEKPAAFGSDESAWELNRRVVINYLGR